MRHEFWPHCIFTIDRLSSGSRVSSVCQSLPWRSPSAGVLLLGSVSGDGLRSTDLPRELAGHRRVARSTLADANESRDWRIYADFAQVLIGSARSLYARDPIGVDLEQSLYALDSTTIDLCLSLFPWARFRRHKAAVKMHTLLDLRGSIPTFVRMTAGQVCTTSTSSTKFRPKREPST